MDIQKWLKEKGSFKDGIALYSALPGCNQSLLKTLTTESTVNFLKLKYELKMALEAGKGAITPKKENTAPQPIKKPQKQSLLKEIIKQSADVSFSKENMAMYPAELHSTYRNRIHDFYLACELKFKLNATADDDEETALEIIIKLEEVWNRVDRAWMVLNHWKDHRRIMPVEVSEDFSLLNGIQLVKRRDQLETSISKRKITLAKLMAQAEASPEDRTLQNKFNKKKEQLQQLLLDREIIRDHLQKEVERK